MSGSDEWTEWHLTPRGWERGSEKGDAGPAEMRPRPADAVLTFRHREQVSGMYSPVHGTTREEWRSSNAALVAELLGTYGDCPERL